MKISWGEQKAANLIAFTALAFVIISFFRDCCQDRKIEELSYNYQAIEHRPKLIVVHEPVIESFELRSGELSSSDLIADSDSIDIGQGIVDIPCVLTIRSKLKVTNRGNWLAKMCARFVCDTTSGSDNIREYLLDDKTRENRFRLLPTEDYFKLKEIAPGDTIDLGFVDKVAFMSDGSFTVHYLMLYENEVGALYDTYYWARYQTLPVYVKPEYKTVDGKLYMRLIYNRQSFKDLLRLEETNPSWNTYSMEEAEDIKGFLKRLAGESSS